MRQCSQRGTLRHRCCETGLWHRALGPFFDTAELSPRHLDLLDKGRKQTYVLAVPRALPPLLPTILPRLWKLQCHLPLPQAATPSCVTCSPDGSLPSFLTEGQSSTTCLYLPLSPQCRVGQDGAVPSLWPGNRRPGVCSQLCCWPAYHCRQVSSPSCLQFSCDWLGTVLAWLCHSPLCCTMQGPMAELWMMITGAAWSRPGPNQYPSCLSPQLV